MKRYINFLCDYCTLTETVILFLIIRHRKLDQKFHGIKSCLLSIVTPQCVFQYTYIVTGFFITKRM